LPTDCLLNIIKLWLIGKKKLATHFVSFFCFFLFVSVIVVDWNPGSSREHFPTQILTFPDYSISNKFPNNVLLLRDASIVVCTSIIKKDSVFQIRGMKFEKLKDAFTEPHVSSRFNTVLASKLGGYGIWNVNAIRGKMFACPFDRNDCSTLPNIVTEKTATWFVTPIRHTLNNIE
jgi:hypothetical protein